MSDNFHCAEPIAPQKYGKLRFERKFSIPHIVGRVGVYGALVFLTLLFVVPYLWLVLSSFKTPDAFNSFSFLPRDAEGTIHFVFDNYIEAWEYLDIPTVLGNTLLVCVVNTVVNLFLNSLSAYAFARMKFAGRDKIFIISLTSMMIPGCVMLIPNFIIINTMGLYDNLLSLILPFVMSIYNVFLLRQQFMAVEREIEEAAFIDGAGSFRVFWKVCLPIVKPTLIVLGITTFMWNYNNFLWPLITLPSSENYTLAVSLGNLMSSNNSELFPVILAGAVMVSAPMIIAFFFLQKFILGGNMDGAVKG